MLILLLAAVCRIAPVQSANEDGTLKLISFNMRTAWGRDGDNSWMNRRSASVEMLRREAPDVMGVQEAMQEQLLYLDAECPQYARVGEDRDGGAEGGETMAVFYLRDRFDLLADGTFWLSETPDRVSRGWDAACNRTVTWVELRDKMSGRTFFYFNTHLDHVGKQAQEKGLALIMDRIAELNTSGLPVILTGDFNVKPGDPVLDRLDNMMRSARIYAEKTDSRGTYNNWGKSSDIIDYIYYSGFRSCPEFRTVTQKFGEWPFISDHYPVEAVLGF